MGKFLKWLRCFTYHPVTEWTAHRVYIGKAGECWHMRCEKCGREWLEL